MAKPFDNPLTVAARGLANIKRADRSLDAALGYAGIHSTLADHAAGQDGGLRDHMGTASVLFRTIADQRSAGLSSDLANRIGQGTSRAVADAIALINGRGGTDASASAWLTPPISTSASRPDAGNAVAQVADLGAAIRDVRKGLKLSQQAFADLAGVGRRFLSELEGGKASVEFGKVLACCAAAGIDLRAIRRRVT